MNSYDRVPNVPVIGIKTQAGCLNCPSAFDCGTLMLALTIKKQRWESETDSRIKANIEIFIKKIHNEGFDYPHAQSGCILKDQKEKIRALTQEAIDLSFTWRSSSF